MENLIAAPEIIIMGILGILFIFIGRHFQIKYQRFKRHGLQTDATIIELKRWKNNYSPKVQYSHEGKIYEAQLKIRLEQNAYKIGQKLPIVYLAQAPEQIMIAPKSYFTGLFIFLQLTGLILIGMFLISVIYR
ncbi:MAG: DUF3592 domain-containing protein [Cyclobacteriaceae bacterium]